MFKSQLCFIEGFSSFSKILFSLTMISLEINVKFGLNSYIPPHKKTRGPEGPEALT